MNPHEHSWVTIIYSLSWLEMGISSWPTPTTTGSNIKISHIQGSSVKVRVLSLLKTGSSELFLFAIKSVSVVTGEHVRVLDLVFVCRQWLLCWRCFVFSSMKIHFLSVRGIPARTQKRGPISLGVREPTQRDSTPVRIWNRFLFSTTALLLLRTEKQKGEKVQSLLLLYYEWTFWDDEENFS